MRTYCLPFLFFLLFPFSTHSQMRPVQKYVVLGLSVEGNVSSEPTAILASAGISVGDTITYPSEKKFRTALERLWAMKIFSDVQIVVENIIGNGMYLVFRVNELPRFSRWEISGNDELDEDDIEKKGDLKKGEIVSPQKMASIIKKIKAEYEKENFLNAAIEYTLEKDAEEKENYVIVKMKVTEGEEVYVGKIEIEGNTAFDDDDLKSELSETHEYTWWKFWRSSKFDKKKYEEDKQSLLSFYKKNGYKDFQLISDSTENLSEAGAIALRLHINEGEQYKVRNIIWEGNSIYTSDELNARLGFENGDVYDTQKFEENLKGNRDQTDVASLYLDNGYLTFSAEPEEQRVGEDSLDITIHISERNQFRNGDIGITGNTKTQDNVIRRELFTLPSEYFNRAKIFRSIRQLSQLNYFNPEKIRPDYKLIDDKTVNLIYSVEEKSSDEVNASVGYSQAFGATGALGFTINNFSLAEPLSGGAGQILNFQWQFGEGNRFRTFSLNFTEPWLYNTPTSVGFSIFDTRQVYVFDYRQTGISGRVGRRLKWPDDFFRGDWEMRYQQNNTLSGGGIYLEGKTSQVSVSQVISRNSTDSPIFPAVGSNVSLSTEMSGGPILPGNVDYFKLNFSSEKYTPILGNNKFVFYNSLQAGYVSGFTKDSKIPPIEYFFMGGTGIGYFNTIPLRGYEDRTIGPQTAGGATRGGSVFFKSTVELRYSLTLNPIPIYLLTFAEGGNVWDKPKEIDVFNLKRSIGFGARLLILPIGMIGFDYGYGFDDVYFRDGNPDGWRFHFVFGKGF
ncbi:MAG: outer membrane protein assembly factor BamA [Ignavibacteriales bacterium]|nr:outer membrane protein assembly factor BamA [Ignavibacteriales bacterium]